VLQLDGGVPFEVPEHIEPLVTVFILAHFVIIGGLVCWGLRQVLRQVLPAGHRHAAVEEGIVIQTK
jgi:hypothetical protein